MRRAQAALEFLTTYGWAFIVILVMIGALAYFGVLSPSKVTPSRCIIESGFTCKDFQITTTNVSIYILNGKGEGLTVNTITLSSDAPTGVITCTAPTLPASITDAGNITIFCSFATPLTTSKGDKVKLEFAVNYKMAKGTYTQNFGGSIYGQVQ
jgi:hypothetical protein